MRLAAGGLESVSGAEGRELIRELLLYQRGLEDENQQLRKTLQKLERNRVDREAFGRSIFEATPAVIILLSPDQKILDFNPKAEHLYGKKRKDVLGKDYSELFLPEEVRGLVRADIEKVLCGTPTVGFENELPLPDGRSCFLSWFVSRSLNSQGDPNGIIAIGLDITERMQCEGALKASESKYRKLHESMRDAFVSVDMEGRIVECNEAFTNMLGYSKSELLALTYQSLMPKKWAFRVARIVREQILKRGYSDVLETAYRRKDGTVLPVELRSYLMKDESGDAANVWGIVRDITGRKEAEKRLIRSEKKFRKTARNLEQANTALKFVLEKKDEVRAMMEERVLCNLNDLVFPCLEELKARGSDCATRTLLNALESKLNEITSSFSRNLSSKSLNLTPAEIRIADLIRHGKSTKEIAAIRCQSTATVEYHRKNIRKKLGLQNKRTNLRTYLGSLP